MTHLWRKQLSKDADLIFSVPCGPTFWPQSMHEPLVILIVLPLHHVNRYQGPWLVKATDAAVRTEDTLSQGFKVWNNPHYVPGKFPLVDGEVPGLWGSQEEWSRSVLFEFLNAQRKFPPVQECMVRGLLRGSSERPVSGPAPFRGRRRNRGRSEGGLRSCKRTRRGSPDGNPV